VESQPHTMSPGGASIGALRPPVRRFVPATGKVTRLVTAMYFEGEALNDQDRILKTSFNPKSQMTQAHPNENALRATWDIVLMTG